MRCTPNAAQSIANSTGVFLNFNTETYDTDGFHDTVTNNTRLTVPSGKAGKYRIYGLVECASNATAHRSCNLRVNGATYIASVTQPAVTGVSNVTELYVATEYTLAVGDYVEFGVYQASGGALNSASNSDYSPCFGMSLLGT